MLTDWLPKWGRIFNLKALRRVVWAGLHRRQPPANAAASLFAWPPVDSEADPSPILEAALQVSSVLTTTPSLADAAQAVIRIFAVDGWALWRWDHPHNSFHSIMNYGLLSPEAQGPVLSFEAQSFPAAAQAISQGDPFVVDINDAQTSEADRRWLQERYWSRLLLTPLLYQQQVIGLSCLYCGSAKTQSFTLGQMRLSQVLAGQVAVRLKHDELVADLATKNETVRHISQQLVQAQEAERRRISRELHDELGQALTALKINIDLAGRAMPENPSPRLQRSLGEAARLAEEILTTVHNLSLELRPVMLDDLGLIPALRWSLDRYEQRTGQTVHFKASLSDMPLGSALETTLYRIIQEALTNVARHAQARQVWIELKKVGHELIVRVEDDGQGFEVAGRLPDPTGRVSLGLAGMEERATMMAGTLQVTSQPGAGTWVEARFPLSGSEISDQKG